MTVPVVVVAESGLELDDDPSVASDSVLGVLRIRPSGPVDEPDLTTPEVAPPVPEPVSLQ